MTRSKGFDKSWLILALIVVVAIGTGVVLYLQLRTDTITDDVKHGNGINVAFFISDGDELICTEVLLFNPTTGKAATFDIPGEWGDVIESVERMDRIDVLFDPSNVSPYLAKIESLLDLQIPYYISLDLDGVERIVDLLEGMEMFIANPVEVAEENRIVLLPSGSLVLDGRKVRIYISYADPGESEIEHRARHQKFIQALVKGFGENSYTIVQDEVFSFLRTNLTTNLKKRALQSFIAEMPRLDSERIVPKAVHGDLVSVDGKTLLFPHFEGKLIRESVRQTVESLANTEIVSAEELTVVLEILNGTPRNGLATRTSQLFANFGYEVGRVGNADREDYQNTTVIAHGENIAAAHRIAELIQCSRVQEAPPEAVAATQGIDLEAIDVTIVLGMDFDGRYCKE